MNIGGYRWAAPPSKREWEALMLSADGCNIRELAEKMGVGERTAKTYSDALRLKLGLGSGMNARRLLIPIAQEMKAKRVVYP